MKSSPLDRIMFFDTETTGVENPRLVQLAYSGYNDKGKSGNHLFKPPIEIDFHAMATHHITPEMVQDKPLFADSQVKQWLKKKEKAYVWVAHNSEFDCLVMKNEGVDITYCIDTLKVARKILLQEDGKQYPSYALQYLRYRLGLYRYETENFIAHDAYSDIMVLRILFQHILNTMRAEKNAADGSQDSIILNEMVTMTKGFSYIQIMPFGKYKGMEIVDMVRSDYDYSLWCIKEVQDVDLAFNVKQAVIAVYGKEINF